MRTTDPSPSASASTLLALAAKAADEAVYERVSELFAAAQRQGISPQERPRWRRLLIEAGDFRAAASAAEGAERCSAPLECGSSAPASAERCSTPQGAGGGGAGSLEGGSAAAAEAQDDVLDFEPGSRAEETPAVPGELVAAFLRWFAGRGDVHARQWYDARRDRSGYWPVREPLTEHVVEQHLLGRITLGQYVLHPDNTVSFAALDLDPTAEAIEQARLAGGEDGALQSSALTVYARRIIEVGQRLGLPVFAEDTGGLGLHLWLFFCPRLAAERARGLLRELLWRTGAQPPAVAVEVFPKQDRLGGKGLGNLIKLPFGVHQVTLRPSRFLDARLEPCAAEQALAVLRACPPESVDAALARRVVALPRAGGAPAEDGRLREQPLRLPQDPTPRALAEALAAIPAGREATAAADRILAGCAVVRELSRQAHEGPPLSADAARALLYTVGLVGRENERIDAIFAQAGVSRKELDRVRRGLQGPVGCKTLRARFGNVAASCTCPEPPANGYATPVLFAFREPPAGHRAEAAWPAVPSVEGDTGEEFGASIEQRLARIEGALERLLGERGDG